MLASRRSVCRGLLASTLSLEASKRLFADPSLGGAPYPQLEQVAIGGVTIRLGKLPRYLVHDSDAGLLMSRPAVAQRVHARPAPDDWCGESRCAITPAGDYLLMFTAGTAHYGGKTQKVNDMVAYRSSDQGRTWTGPTFPWKVPYNQHGFVPLIPRGGKRIYAFGTEPIFNRIEDRENAPIGFRTSDDDGHSWSAVTLIRPSDDPEYLGMFVMRMCETANGTWLLAPHSGMSRNPRHTRLYIMRSSDRGKNWNLLPGPRPRGWTEPKYGRMEEGRPIALDGGNVLLIVRTAEGHLWQLRSHDDGLTWSDPQPTPLVHPLAPPMVFTLSDRKTLVAFHHNRYTGGETDHPSGADRSELWASLSHDGGARWSEPRFVLANTNAPGHFGPFADSSVSYVDAIAGAGTLHVFISHQFRQVLHVRFPEASLRAFPARRDL